MARKNPNKELKDALTDVRRAYRLLWAFQKRMLDYNVIIRDRMGFEHYKIDEYFSKMHNKKAPECGNLWSWRYLPLSYMGILSTRYQGSKRRNPKTSPVKAGDMLLDVVLAPDSALTDIYDNDNSKEPLPQDFKKPELCSSKIYLYLCVNRVDRKYGGDSFWVKEIISSDNFDWPDHQKLTRNKEYDIDVYGEIWDIEELPGEDELLKYIDMFSNTASKKLKIELKDS